MQLIHDQLDPVFEIYTLLYLAPQKEAYLKDIEHTWNELGVNGTEFIKDKNINAFCTYLDTFAEHMVTDAGVRYFEGPFDPLMIPMFSNFLPTIREIYQSEGEIDFSIYDQAFVLEKLRSNILEVSEIAVQEDQPFDFDYFMECLFHTSLDCTTKWILLSIVRDPVLFFEDTVQLIRRNEQAYERAKDSVKKELIMYINDFTRWFEEKADERFTHLLDLSSATTKHIYPSFSKGASINSFLTAGLYYYGLIVDQLMNTENELELKKTDLLMKTKALSDKSKIDILLTLRERPMFSLEISEKMSLSPSTTSHHMNMLVSSGLVQVIKQKGKVYYNINKDGFNSLKDVLTELF